MRPTARHTRAFTLIELLVVISIIALLIAILLPALGSAKKLAVQSQCMSNLKQFGIAWHGFSTDNKGEIVGSENGSRTWYDGVDDYTASTAWVYSPFASGRGYETLDDIKNGDLWEYIETYDVYLCPADPRTDYIRSYSISTFLNGQSWMDPSNSVFKPVRNIDKIPEPTETLFMVDEPDPRGWTINSFSIYPYGVGSSHRWIDWPADFHFDGFTHGFADGHVEFYGFQDSRTSDIVSFYTPHPGSKDWEYVADHFDPGRPNNP